MVRHKLVRQGAMNIRSGSDSAMASPLHVRRRRHSKEAFSLRRMSSESLDDLLVSPGSNVGTERKPSGRRHSLACGALTIDVQGSSFKSALNSAVKKVSSACSVLSSAPSTTFNLAPPPPRNKEEEIILPPVLATFHRDRLPIPPNCTFYNKGYHSNRRFSSDRPPPIYNEAWKQQVAVDKHKLTRQQEVYVSNGSHGSVEDDAFENFEDRLVN